MSISSQFETNINLSYEEIIYNLGVISNTLNSESNIVDTGFVDIFKSAIGNLQNNKDIEREKIVKLSQSLDSISDKIKDLATKNLQPENRPLVGPIKDLSVVADSYLESSMKSGLNKLDPIIKMNPIKQDNHSLYRSVIAGYVTDKWCKLSKEDQTKEIARLEQLLEGFEKTLHELFKDLPFNPEKIFKNVKAILSEITPENVDQVLNSIEKSNCLVEFSRMLVSGYYFQNPNKTVEDNAKRFNKDLNCYLLDLATMSKEHFSGKTEIQALSKVLGLQIQVNDVCGIGANEPIDNPKSLYQSNSNDQHIDILLQLGHYNRGVRKSQSTDTPKKPEDKPTTNTEDNSWKLPGPIQDAISYWSSFLPKSFQV